MALIGKIRNNSWLLIVMIALGLGGFIFMDMFSGQQSLFGSSAGEMAEIDGRSVDIKEFTRAENILYSNASGDQYSRRQFLFNSFVDETLVKKEAEAMGLGVSDAELEDLTFGNNPSPIITARFSDPQTGQLNRQALNTYKDDVRPAQADAFWNYQKGEIRTDRLKSKIVTMVEKAIYTPTWLAEMASNDKTAYRSVAIVKVPYDAIENDAVTLSDADYSAYLSENAAKYETTEEQRKVEYIVFPVEATDEDKEAIRTGMTELAAEFRTTDNDTTFISANSGQMSPQWLTKDKLPAAVADTLAGMSAGAVYGPYLEGNTYRLTKVRERVTMQDSAKVRHILINATTPAEFTTAEKRADSLINVIRTTDVSWDTLALRHSDDPGSKNKGGFYDFAPVNTYVPEFNDAAFLKPVGSLQVVRTQFGVHLIEPLGTKGESKDYYRLATVSESVIPSDQTQRNVENRVIEFVDNNRTRSAMVKSANEQGLELQTTPPLKANDFVVGTLGSGQASRDIVRWAFGKDINLGDTEVGDVSPEFYAYNNAQEFYTDKYVVVALKGIQKPGKPGVNDVKEEIEPFVINAKKAEVLKERIGSNTDLNAIAAQFEEVQVDTVNGITFGGPSITNVGIEPAVQGAVYTTPVNTVSAPVAGNGGVFVVKSLNESPSQSTQTLAQKKAEVSNGVRQQVKARLIQGLRKNVKIEDNRATYF